LPLTVPAAAPVQPVQQPAYSWTDAALDKGPAFSLPASALPPKNPKLQTCKDCGGQVSPNATACPHCGSKAFNTASQLNQFSKNLMGCGCLLFVLGILPPILFFFSVGAFVGLKGGKPVQQQVR
jgi:ribosomal protein L40E